MALLESSTTVLLPQPTSSIENSAGRTVVSLRGEHDVSTVPALFKTLARATALADLDVVLDLSEVEFMDAATIGAFIRARRCLGLRSLSLTLQSPSPCAQRALDICGLALLVDPSAGTDLCSNEL